MIAKCVGIFIFLVLQWLLTPQWRYPRLPDDIQDTINEFCQLKEEKIQAVFLGTSASELSVDPMAIYLQSGIASFNLSTSSQPLVMSEFLLTKAFKTQKPSVVFLEAGNLFFYEDNFSVIYSVTSDNY